MNDEPKRLECIIASLSDSHIAEREFREDGTLNPITDFFAGSHLVAWLNKLRGRGLGAREKYLVLNGDIFDSQLVALLGEYEDPPLLSFAVYKIRRIINMQTEIFDALKSLVDNGWTIVYTIGNHDAFIAWPRVQRELGMRIARNSPERLIFCDEMEIRGILFRHLYEVEPFNTLPPPEDKFSRGYTVKFGKTKFWISEALLPLVQKKTQKTETSNYTAHDDY